MKCFFIIKNLFFLFLAFFFLTPQAIAQNDARSPNGFEESATVVPIRREGPSPVIFETVFVSALERSEITKLLDRYTIRCRKANTRSRRDECANLLTRLFYNPNISNRDLTRATELLNEINIERLSAGEPPTTPPVNPRDLLQERLDEITEKCSTTEDEEEREQCIKDLLDVSRSPYIDRTIFNQILEEIEAINIQRPSGETPTPVPATPSSVLTREIDDIIENCEETETEEERNQCAEDLLSFLDNPNITPEQEEKIIKAIGDINGQRGPNETQHQFLILLKIEKLVGLE